jgi:hypothetical protein
MLLKRGSTMFYLDTEGDKVERIPTGHVHFYAPPGGTPHFYINDLYAPETKSTSVENYNKKEHDFSRGISFDGCSYWDLIKKDFIGWVNNPKWYYDHTDSGRRGILLYGPPGTGKTSVGRKLAAEAVSEYGIPAFDNPKPVHYESLDLCGVRRVVIIDEIDFNGEQFTSMFDNLEDCFVIATTNNYHLHERITKRPGRFDRVIEIAHAPIGMIRAIASNLGIIHLTDKINKNALEIGCIVTPAIITEIASRIILGYEEVDSIVTVLNEFKTNRTQPFNAARDLGSLLKGPPTKDES